MELNSGGKVSGTLVISGQREVTLLGNPGAGVNAYGGLEGEINPLSGDSQIAVKVGLSVGIGMEPVRVDLAKIGVGANTSGEGLVEIQVLIGQGSVRCVQTRTTGGDSNDFENSLRERAREAKDNLIENHEKLEYGERVRNTA
jgi:hypothetical protein